MILLDTNVLIRIARSAEPQSRQTVRLVAAMQSYGISKLLSFNAGDFRDLPVTAVNPVAL
jgi:predicted nucleic acid-binding protein